MLHNQEKIYGTNRDGKFEGFSAFCQHVFSKDSMDGLGLYIVKPDPAKGHGKFVLPLKSSQAVAS